MSFFDFIRPKDGKPEYKEVSCKELLEAAQEASLRRLCWQICVNMIAAALGRCEFRTYLNNKEVRAGEYWLWNIEPNPNQNSTEFLHELITRLYADGEALVVDPARNGQLYVAESFQKSSMRPGWMCEYTGVEVGDTQYTRTFYEPDVLYFRINTENIKPVLDAVNNAHTRLIEAASKNYKWNHGQHWKVHVDQIAQGGENWVANFQSMMDEQVKPFLNSDGAVLPEFDGYLYENVGGDSREDSRDIRDMMEDIFEFTARAFHIPAVLTSGKVEGTQDANARFLTNCIDPLCDLLQEEITRKRYGFTRWARGDFLRVDSSSIIHFDLFAQAANIEKIIGSGAYTINDVLRAAGQPPIDEPWANRHYLTLNIGTLSAQTRDLEGGEE